VPGHSLAQQISNVVRTISGVQEIEEVQAHRFGPFLVINVTIGVDGALTVAAGDEIASQVEQALCREVDLVRRAYVHYHPVSAANKHGMQPCEVG
jgi:divalent metal cation (Fe/Co/Zn/Cd) transporter